jgi:hypothetical protein
MQPLSGVLVLDFTTLLPGPLATLLLAEAGAEAAAEDGVNVFSDNEEVWDVLADIPNDTAAALLLIEHHWAVPLRDAVARAGGFRLADGFISPLDLVSIGLLDAGEAKEMHDMEKAATAK